MNIEHARTVLCSTCARPVAETGSVSMVVNSQGDPVPDLNPLNPLAAECTCGNDTVLFHGDDFTFAVVPDPLIETSQRVRQLVPEL